MHYLTEEERHYEKYIDVAMELLTTNSDISPSARALIERLGGSMTTANKAMRVFWRYVGRRLSYDQQYPEGMPLEVIKLMEKVIAMAREAAKKELQAEWVKTGEQVKVLETDKLLMEQSIESLHQALDQEISHHAVLKNEFEATKQHLVTAESKSEVLMLKNMTLSVEISSYKRELENHCEQLKESHTHQLSLRNELNDKTERMIAKELQNQTLTERVDNHAKKEIEYKKELERLQKKIDSLESLNTVTQEALNEKNTALARMEVEMGEGQRYCLKLETDLECSIKRQSYLEHQFSIISTELVELRALKLRIDEVKGQVSDLRGERDRLIKLLEEKTQARKLARKKVKVGAFS